MARCTLIAIGRRAVPPLIDLDDSDDTLNTSESEREIDYILNLVLDDDGKKRKAEETDESSDSNSSMHLDENMVLPQISVRCLHENNDCTSSENIMVQQAVVNTEETEELEEHPHLMPLIVKTEGSFSCSSDCTAERPDICLPARHCWDGSCNFRIKISYDVNGKKNDSAAYSEVENKLYVCKDFVFRVLCSAKNVPSGSVIRATAVFTLAEHAFEIVQRCPIHIHQDIMKGDPIYEHLIQCLSEQALYEKNSLSGRYSVTVPYEQPQDGEEFSMYAYKLTCFSSCTGGINRRPFMILFTLENNGAHLGRQVLEIKVCACPTRDRRLDLEKYFKRRNALQPATKDEVDNTSTCLPEGQTSAESQPPSNYTITVEDPKLYRFLVEMKNFYESSAYIQQMKEKAVFHLT